MKAKGIFDLFIKYDQTKAKKIIQQGRKLNFNNTATKLRFPRNRSASEAIIFSNGMKTVQQRNLEMSKFLVDALGLWFDVGKSDTLILCKEKNCYTVVNRTKLQWWEAKV